MVGIWISSLTQPGFVPMSFTQRLFSRCARPLRFATCNGRSLSSNIKLKQLGIDSSTTSWTSPGTARDSKGSKSAAYEDGMMRCYTAHAEGRNGFRTWPQTTTVNMQLLKSISDRVAVITFWFGKQDVLICAVCIISSCNVRMV